MQAMPSSIDKILEERITTDSDDIEIVDRFFNLDHVLSSWESTHETVSSKVRSALKKFKDVFSALCKKGISLEFKEA